MKILFVGDVVGKVGCDCVARLLPKIKRQHGIDLTVINCENASATNGVMPAAAHLPSTCSMFCCRWGIFTSSRGNCRSIA